MDYTTKLSNNTNPSFKMTREEIAFAAYYKATEDGMINIAKFFEIVMEGTNKMMIEKACEWIHSALYLDHERSIEHRYATLEELLNDFRKAMEGD